MSLFPRFLEGSITENVERTNLIGVPTANFSTDSAYTENLRPRSYYGWIQIEDDVHKVVISVEMNESNKQNMYLYMFHSPTKECTGKVVKIIILNCMRGEFRFSSAQTLKEVIHVDLTYANTILKSPECQFCQRHAFFQGK